MRTATVERVVEIPCFVRRGLGLLDASHKLLLLELALLSEDGRVCVLNHSLARAVRSQTALSSPLRFASALRRLEAGGFIEIAGNVSTDRFTVYFVESFQ